MNETNTNEWNHHPDVTTKVTATFCRTSRKCHATPELFFRQQRTRSTFSSNVDYLIEKWWWRWRQKWAPIGGLAEASLRRPHPIATPSRSTIVLGLTDTSLAALSPAFRSFVLRLLLLLFFSLLSLLLLLPLLLLL